MNVLTRYLLKEFFKLLIVCQLVFIALYLMIDFASGIDDFIKADAPRSVMIAYFAFKIPAIASQMLPPAILTTVIILFSLMKRNNEMVALKASGVNTWQVAQPLVLLAAFLSVVLFFFSETIVPYASSRCNEIWRIEVKKEHPGRFHGQNHVWYKGKNCIYFIKQFDSRKMMMVDPTFYFFDDKFKITRRIDGRRAVWKENIWQVQNGIVQNREKDGTYDLQKFEHLEVKLDENPKDFIRQNVEPEEMGYVQLKRFARRLKLEGYDATRYFVELNIKIAFPFIVLIMTLMGIPVALWKKGMGTPVAVCIGISLCFVYLLVLGLARTLGFAGILPPLFSAWLANSIFLFFGVYMMIHANR
ncbi:MAG: LPS export ABC transporter permease LptG [Deltaproteobacteria bacterium]|nr:LPS export ABC transporter permease LptG [Deltaproteobacteria bacterium]